MPGSVLPEDSIPRDHQFSAPAGVFGNSPLFLVPFASNLQEVRCLTLQPGFSLPCPALPCIPTFPASSAEPHSCPLPTYFITPKELTGPPVPFPTYTLIPRLCPSHPLPASDGTIRTFKAQPRSSRKQRTPSKDSGKEAPFYTNDCENQYEVSQNTNSKYCRT